MTTHIKTLLGTRDGMDETEVEDRKRFGADVDAYVKLIRDAYVRGEDPAAIARDACVSLETVTHIAYDLSRPH